MIIKASSSTIMRDSNQIYSWLRIKNLILPTCLAVTKFALMHVSQIVNATRDTYTPWKYSYTLFVMQSENIFIVKFNVCDG